MFRLSRVNEPELGLTAGVFKKVLAKGKANLPAIHYLKSK